ncbi:MAG: presqualene diphosphate synthase HpnD [Betaproteobacteria bacterium]|nr:presqualene diphosphate synthase HpnD [Betaproteobacteria bacterium]MDH5220779.1 presqualene diphosphate synthase HpnD [Betaproteobacteria bacterium]MDH5350216.1 presqualene diphosphate synthase HpnD [Betaproteobacteria bacterium]
MTPDQYCQRKAAASGSSFYYAFRFLPPPRRRAITALYAFCREVDDVVDEASDAQLAATRLAWWRQEIALLFDGRPQHPVSRALQPALAPFGITAARLNEIVDGVEMDLTQTRYLDFAGLERYCYRVAGVVGILAAGIFGYTDPRTLEYAKSLGTALQLTNIIRDVGEDARNNRIYLPIEDLQRFGVSAADLLQGRHGEAFVALMRYQAARARDFYARAMEALPAADRRAQRPGLIMAAIYRTLLEEIERDGFQVLRQRTSLTPLRKLWVAWKTWLAA